jgi:hypothetical protein
VKALESPLGQILEASITNPRCTRDEMTVLSPQIDPYRADSKREGAEWFAALFDRFFVQTGRPCHLRGAHYAAVSVELPKPDGTPYRNTDSDYAWLGRQATAARYLGLVDPGEIGDERSDEPIVITRPDVGHSTDSAHEVAADSVPDIDGIAIIPDIGEMTMAHIHERQPYTLAVFGEKSSLREVVEPICTEFGADLFISSGEFSITHAHQLAKRAVDDGRRLILFTLTDCDPAGYQMSVSIIHKLRAFADGKFKDKLEFDVIPVAITIEQATELDLPSTPLKPKEMRASRWREAFGREQTEIDALLALHPDFLDRELRGAITPYFDSTLRDRTAEALREWRSEAEASIADQVGDEIEALRAEHGDRLEELKASVTEIESALDDLKARITLPEFEAPEADVPEADGDNVLVSSDMDYREHVAVCKARKRYGIGVEAEAAS